MAKNKKYVYLQLYPKDLLADEKLAKCDKASAWGAYLALLNIMSMEEIRGCVRLRDWDSHPNNERKSLVANFRRAISLRTKAAAFARVVAQCTPLKVGPMAEGIEQLLIFGVIVMHDDALIQPRMFRDSHSILEGYEPEPEPAEETAEDGVDKGASAPLKKEKNKENFAPARTLRANTHTRFENESENNIYNKGNKGVQGDDATETADAPKTPVKTPKTKNEPSRGVLEEEVNNLLPDVQKTDSEPQNTRKRPSAVADNPPTLEDIQAYMDERAQQGKPFVYVTAESFLDACEQSGWRLKDGKPMMDWRARMRTFENYRKEHGDRPMVQGTGQVLVAPKPGDPVQATPTAKGKYKKKW